MLTFMIGVVLGAFSAWLYTSPTGRNQAHQWWSRTSEPVRQHVSSLATTTVSGAQRLGAARPMPDEQPLTAFVDNPVPDDVLAEQDASAQAAAEARHERETGA